MSILIKGLNIKEMVYCPFCGEEYGECLISKNREYCERLEKCPYEIIPKHGDLMEKDLALAIVNAPATTEAEFVEKMLMVQAMIDAPVVIPAERSE